MEDDIRPNDEHENEQEEPPRPEKHLDRLINAKEKAEKEAEHWSHIEEIGKPVPSYDPLDLDTTQPSTPDQAPPARQKQPREQAEEPSRPVTGEVTPGQRPPRSSQRKDTPPPFPHPTDPVPPPQPAYQQQDNEDDTATGPRADLFQEPPVPDEFAEQQPSDLTPRGKQAHERYEPSPDRLKDVRLDGSGMPLPRHVSHEDLDATLVGRSAYSDDIIPSEDRVIPEQPSYQPVTPQPQYYDEEYQYEEEQYHREVKPAPPPQRRERQPVPPERPQRSRRKKGRRRSRISMGCIMRTIALLFFSGIVLSVIGFAGIAIYYSQVTAPAFRGINSITDLQERALKFETTRIYDREGNLLYEINDPNGGRRDYVTLDEVSPWIIVATVSTEERDYFTNPGFSITAIARAMYQNLRSGEIVSGASTITQQLTEALLLPEEKRTDRSYETKVEEIFLAAELGRRFSKQEILELYLNQIPYGNLAYGIEAAAQTYFNKSAKDLSLAESAFLAGLPQAPALWDPVTNKEGSLIRYEQVLQLTNEAGCLDTGTTGLQLPCVTSDLLRSAEVQADLYNVITREYRSPDIQAKYPHWVVYVQRQLEADLGNAIYTSGYDVYTTIDPRIQDVAQEQVELALASLADRNVTNASVIVLDVDTGAILAMVGSRNFNDESIDGQVNVALTLQQPGSSIKPFTYLAAFREGWSPATVIWDIPVKYELPGSTYEPVNYDGRFRGPVTVREAIANSLNIPAVLTLDYVGVENLLQVLNDLGIDSLGDPSNPNQYGLSLTLGAGEVYLLDWTNAYATIANGGTFREVYSIDRIERNGQVLEGYPHQISPGEQRIDPAQAYLLQDILSDKEARVPSFGVNSVLSPPDYDAGAKTGTTNDFRDNWTMGFTTELAVGVWVGNTDNSSMINVTGVSGAGPIWRGILDASREWYPPREFTPRPEAYVFPQNVCADDGAQPSRYCQEHSSLRTDFFAADPLPAEESIYREVRVDQFSGLIANQNCEQFVADRLYVVLPSYSDIIDTPAYIREWLLTTEAGTNWLTQRGITPEMLSLSLPDAECDENTAQPVVIITEPLEGSVMGNLITVYGSVDAPNFSHYRVDFGVSHSPQAWGVLQGNTSVAIQDGALGQIDLASFENGPMSIRVIVFDTEGRSAERTVHFQLLKPAATAEPTAVPTATPTSTPTSTPTPVPSATPTILGPAPVESPTPTP